MAKKKATTKSKPISKPISKPKLHPGDAELLADFVRTREVTIDLLKRVPPKLLSQKAHGEDETLGELFHHIAIVVDAWMFRCMNDGGPPPSKYKAGKAGLLKSMESSRKRLLKFFHARDGAAMDTVYRREREGKTYVFVGRNRVAYLTGHESHHRGKIILAVRQWGFTEIPFIPFAHTEQK